jgi:hypothetical protein
VQRLTCDYVAIKVKIIEGKIAVGMHVAAQEVVSPITKGRA